MASEVILGTLIGGGFTLIGITATIIGQIISDRLNHKRKVRYLKREVFFKQKFENYNQINKRLSEEIKECRFFIEELEILYSQKSVDKFLDKLDKNTEDFELHKIDLFESEKLIKELKLYFDIRDKLIDKIKEKRFTKLEKIFEELRNKRFEVCDIMKEELEL